jgi:hypothetical protein
LETLTREHEAAAAAPETPPEPGGDTAVTGRPCPTCGATMAAGQDWCLECGEARPDRLAGAPTWRSGAAVLAVTGVLVAGAAAAAWAGLSADAKRVAAPNAQASLPQAAPPAATQPAAPAAPATPPPTTAAPPAAAQPAAPAKKPSTSPPPSATAAAPPAAPATPAPAAKAPSTTKKSTTTTPRAPKNSAKLVAVDLKPDAASTYNPYARPDDDFTDPASALDGDPATAWTASFSGNQSGAVGVDLTLPDAAGVRALQVRTTTPGMTLEIYASRSSSEPVSIQDPGWDHLATQLDVGSNERIVLGEGTTKYRHVLIWPTEAPPDGDHVALDELKLYR